MLALICLKSFKLFTNILWFGPFLYQYFKHCGILENLEFQDIFFFRKIMPDGQKIYYTIIMLKDSNFFPILTFYYIDIRWPYNW